MGFINNYKKNYGNRYGMLLLLANLFFALIGITWFTGYLLFTGRFNYNAFIIMAVFIYQLFFHKKIVNLVLGILALFFSIWFFLSAMATLHISGTAFTGIMFGISIASLVASGILIFSYQAAHKHGEGL